MFLVMLGNQLNQHRINVIKHLIFSPQNYLQPGEYLPLHIDFTTLSISQLNLELHIRKCREKGKKHRSMNENAFNWLPWQRERRRQQQRRLRFVIFYYSHYQGDISGFYASHIFSYQICSILTSCREGIW